MPVATGYSGSQEGHQSDGVAGPATRTAASHVGSMTERSENALLKKELEWTRERLETVTGELQSTRSRLEAELGEAKETIASLRLELQQTRIRADRSLSDKEHTPSVKSAGSETSRIIIAGRSQPRQPPPVHPLQRMLSKEFWIPAEAEKARRQQKAAVLLQSAARGFLRRKRFSAERKLFAIVSGVRSLSRGAERAPVPAYVVTAVRAGRCWQVAHRYSEWYALDQQLRPLLRNPPSLPPRMPFRYSRLTEKRELALNKYLQKLLQETKHVHRARTLLIAFLTKSHMYWQYGEQPSATQLRARSVLDLSSGSTSVSHVPISSNARTTTTASAGTRGASHGGSSGGGKERERRMLRAWKESSGDSLRSSNGDW